MTEKYLLFDLEDDKSKKLGEVISSASCKKIVNLLAEKEMSETELATSLKMPLNTIEYNLNKLISAGIVEKASRWWSVKGRKIETYKLANKLIVISPKKGNVYSKLKGILPVAAVSGILAGFLGWYYKFGDVLNASRDVVQEKALQTGADMAGSVASASSCVPNLVNVVPSAASSGNVWIWFLAGSLVALVGFLIWNWKKL